MSYNPKYQFSFKNFFGTNVTVQLSYADYTGDIITVIGGASPGTVAWDGDEDNIFDPIRTAKATINIKLDSTYTSLVSDLSDLDDTTCLLTITNDKGFVWYGFVQPDTITRPLTIVYTEIQITAVDVFSLLKGILAVDNLTSLVIWGKQELKYLIDNIFSLGCAGAFSLTDIIENDYGIDFNNSAFEGKTIYEQLQIYADNFNDDTGRPTNGYDILSDILQAFFSFSFISNGKVYLRCPVSVDVSQYKTVRIKSSNTNLMNILDGDSEQISTERGSKEVNCTFSFNNRQGLLDNGTFNQWNEFGMPSDWGLDDDADSHYSQTGNGRAENPFGVKIQDTLEDGNLFVPVTFNTYDNDAVSYSLELKIKYFDWTQLGIPNLPTPTITWNVKMPDDRGGDDWILEQDANGNLFFVQDPDNTGTKPTVQLQPSNGVQSVSIDLPPVTFSQLQIGIQGVSLNASDFDIANHPERAAIIYYGAILSTKVDSGAATGQKVYLTQSKTYSQINSIDAVSIGTIPTGAVVGGALYLNIPYTDSNGLEHAQGDFVPLLVKSDDTTQRTLLHHMVRGNMAFQRQPINKIEMTILSDEIFFEDLLKFENDIMPNVYLQLKNSYDLRTCKQNITALEINRNFLPDGSDSPTSEQDTFEQYDITQDS